MKVSEIREKTNEELLEELEGCRRELFNLRFQWQTEEAVNPAQYSKLRKTIARILTVLRERELGINVDIDKHAKKPESSTETSDAMGASASV